MEYFEVSQCESGIHIEGFPDAVKVIGIEEGWHSKRLADLALHKADLEFADNCLEAINLVPEEPFVIREALWRSAIVHFLKCFGKSSARSQLSFNKIFKEDPKEAKMAFSFFDNLRNKHLIHDENAYAQSIPGAILNNGIKSYKIEKIVCCAAIAITLSQDSYANLKLLIQKTRSWVVVEFDNLCNVLKKELEAKTYEQLLSKESLTFRVPDIDKIEKSR